MICSFDYSGSFWCWCVVDVIDGIIMFVMFWKNDVIDVDREDILVECVEILDFVLYIKLNWKENEIFSDFENIMKERNLLEYFCFLS